MYDTIFPFTVPLRLFNPIPLDLENQILQFYRERAQLDHLFRSSVIRVITVSVAPRENLSFYFLP